MLAAQLLRDAESAHSYLLRDYNIGIELALIHVCTSAYGDNTRYSSGVGFRRSGAWLAYA